MSLSLQIDIPHPLDIEVTIPVALVSEGGSELPITHDGINGRLGYFNSQPAYTHHFTGDIRADVGDDFIELDSEGDFTNRRVVGELQWELTNDSNNLGFSMVGASCYDSESQQRFLSAVASVPEHNALMGFHSFTSAHRAWVIAGLQGNLPRIEARTDSLEGDRRHIVNHSCHGGSYSYGPYDPSDGAPISGQILHHWMDGGAGGAGSQNILWVTPEEFVIGSPTQGLGFYGGPSIARQSLDAWAYLEIEPYGGIDNTQSGAVYARREDLDNLRAAFNESELRHEALRAIILNLSLAEETIP